MKTLRRRTIKGESFVLEETRFVDCVLRDCDLFYSGGLAGWKGTKFPGCRLHLRGSAENTRQVLRGFGMLKPKASIPIALVKPPKKPD
jgi:hypothetical protein